MITIMNHEWVFEHAARQIIGNVVTTRKDENLTGMKLLVLPAMVPMARLRDGLSCR